VSIKSIIKKHPKTSILIFSLIVLYLLLLIPTDTNPLIPEGNKKPFIWNRDSLWKNLESEFIRAGLDGCDKIKNRVDSLFTYSEKILIEKQLKEHLKKVHKVIEESKKAK